MSQDPAQAYLDALDAWGRDLVASCTCSGDDVEKEHRERMLKQSRANLDMALRHMMAAGPRRTSSVRMLAVVVPEDEEDDASKR